jgi:RNA polymerase sigma factor (sigma-70 family)
MKSSPLRHPARVAGASLLRLQSDDRLVELAIAGHAAAFDAIVVRYRTPVLRYCAGIVGASRAEDAAQQVLINAHDALQRTDEVRHLRSWLYRIAHNVSLNVLRSVRDDVPLDGAATAASFVSDGPAAEFERSEKFRATVAALQELPERQRAALVLRELEGRSHDEIADALGVTAGSARQHLMRARVAMRGAVTAVTPYPLIVRLADTLTASSGGAGWSDAVVGAGAGATLTKLTAGVVATGALVGGAVGTDRVVHSGRAPARPAQVVRHAAKAAASSAPAVVVATPIAAKTAAPVTTAAGPSTAGRRSPKHGTHSGSHRAPAPQPLASGDDGGAAHTDSQSSTPSSTSHRGRDGGQSSDQSGSSGSDGRRGSSAEDNSGDITTSRDGSGRHGGDSGAPSSGDGSGKGDGTPEDSGHSGSGSSGSPQSSASGSESATSTPTVSTPTVPALPDGSGSGRSSSAGVPGDSLSPGGSAD